MTPADPDHWSRQVITIVSRSVEAAHAHAIVALTDTLKRTPDGRKTIRRAAQSPSYRAACHRLDELWSQLCGPSMTALSGLIRDARVEFYTEALAAWQAAHPPEFATSAASSIARLNAIRGLVLHGMDLRTEVGSRLADARRSLLATLERAARRSTPERVATDLLDGWRSTTTATITRSALVALSDSRVAIDAIAGLDAIRAEFRPANEFTPS